MRPDIGPAGANGADAADTPWLLLLVCCGCWHAPCNEGVSYNFAPCTGAAAAVAAAAAAAAAAAELVARSMHGNIFRGRAAHEFSGTKVARRCKLGLKGHFFPCTSL